MQNSMLNRRRLLTAGLALAAAPFIVRASSLMELPVRCLQRQTVWGPDGRPAFVAWWHGDRIVSVWAF